MEVINLNLIPNGTNPVVHVSQYDEGRDFRFNLFDGTSVLTLDGTETIECDVKKPDGNIVTVAVTNTSSNYVIVTTTLQMTACSGNSLGTINISKGGVNLYTLNFILYCERSPLENGIQSDSAIHNLESQVEDIVSEQYDSANVIFDNVPTSGHGIPYVVSSDGLLSYIPKNVSDMDDVTITTPVQGEALVFDADGNLVNGTPTLDVDDLDDVTITTPTDGEILVYNNGTWENQANPASTTNFAPDYDGTQTYNTNDKVIYQGLLYVCLEDSVTGAWDGTKWQQISVADLNAELLPIQSGSATNTKDYIDNQIAVSDIASSLTLDINYFVASTKQVYKSGNIVNICLRGSLTATNGTILGTIATYYPKASRIICDFHNNGAPTPITTGAVWLNGENGRMYYFGGSVTSLDVCITVTYICN